MAKGFMKMGSNLMSEKERGKHCTKGNQPDQQAGAACHQIHHLIIHLIIISIFEEYQRFNMAK